MARRPRLFAPGILYHVIVRGNYRQKTFLNARDYQGYLERLGRYRKKFGVTVYAYCLMSNHVHLLVETGFQPLSRFMQGLQQSYTQYFNRKHHKIDDLFQGLSRSFLACQFGLERMYATGCVWQKHDLCSCACDWNEHPLS